MKRYLLLVVALALMMALPTFALTMTSQNAVPDVAITISPHNTLTLGSINVALTAQVSQTKMTTAARLQPLLTGADIRPAPQLTLTAVDQANVASRQARNHEVLASAAERVLNTNSQVTKPAQRVISRLRQVRPRINTRDDEAMTVRLDGNVDTV